MTFKKFVLSLGFIALAVNPAGADILSLSTLSGYLNNLRTVEAEFTQISTDGSLATGSIYIKRPGRIRFEYDPPNEALVLASGGELAIFDPKGDSGPETYPLSKTPLGLILADDLDLARERMVTAHRFDGTSTILGVQDPEHPERGKIALIFTGPEPQLRQWVIEDQNGDQTVVVLNDFVTGNTLGDSLFNIFLNSERRKNR